MSKQYLTTHTVGDAHPTDIFSLAATPSCIFTASGSSSLKLYSTATSDYPLIQTLSGVHKIGCHHVATSSNGRKAASVGFGGEVKLWAQEEGSDQAQWIEEGEIKGTSGIFSNHPYVADGPILVTESAKAGEVWAIALSEDGQYLASTTYDGRINVWDLAANREKIREFETKGSFGMCIDMSSDGTLTASGHASGSIYIFSNATGRLTHSLPGLLAPVRCVRFSPGNSLLAACGDAKIIALYDVASGEQVANLTGHSSWIMSLDWNVSGEYLLSGGWDGKVKVWSTETRQCVATQRESEGDTVWAVKWFRGGRGRGECFATAGSGKSVSFYREAAGG